MEFVFFIVDDQHGSHRLAQPRKRGEQFVKRQGLDQIFHHAEPFGCVMFAREPARDGRRAEWQASKHGGKCARRRVIEHQRLRGRAIEGRHCLIHIRRRLHIDIGQIAIQQALECLLRIDDDHADIDRCRGRP